MWDPYSRFVTDSLFNGLTTYCAHLYDRTWQVMNFLVYTGAKDDPEGKEGLAHFVEHMVSKNLSNGMEYQDAKKFFENVGGSVNFGMTSHRATWCQFFIPKDETILDEALGIFSTMLCGGRLEKYIEREREVIVREFHNAFPSQIEYEAAKLEMENLFPGHKLHRQLRPLGSLQTIQSITQSDLQEFYNSHYVPANISVISVGGFKPEILNQHVARHFGNYKDGVKNAGTILNEAPRIQTNESILELSRFIKGEGTIGEYYTAVALPGNIDKALYNIFYYSLDHLLFIELREKRSWVYSLNMGFALYGELSKAYVSARGIAPNNLFYIDGVVDLCLEQMYCDAELFRRSQEIVAERCFMRDQSGKEICGSAQSDVISFGRIRSTKEEVDSIRSLTLSDLQKAIALFERKKRWTLIKRP